MEVAMLWVVVVVVVPVHSLSFQTMNLKKTKTTMTVVVRWEVVLRLVLHVSWDVVMRGQMANLAPFVFFCCQVAGSRLFPETVVDRQLACGQQCVVRLPLEWRQDRHILIRLDLSGLTGSLPARYHRCESPERWPFLDVRVPLGSESQHGSAMQPWVLRLALFHSNYFCWAAIALIRFLFATPVVIY